MLASKGLITAPCGEPRVGVHVSRPFRMSAFSQPRIRSSTRSRTACWTMRSLTVGMPNGLVRPSPFGMSTRLTACGRYEPSRSALDSSARYSSARAANRSMLCPSTPATPLLARTFVQAAASVLGANTLSTNAYHLPPLTPLPSADSMRFVQTETSAHAKSRGASPPCIASSALAAFCCPDPIIAPLPSYPPSLRRGFAGPSSRDPSLPGAGRSSTTRALTPARLAHAEQVSPLTLPCLPNIQPPTTLWARASLSQSSQRARLISRPRLRHE